MAFAQRAHSPLSALDRAPVWLNSEPLTAAGLRGFDVLINFWTYSCVNWLRTLPYLTAWNERYRDRGIVIVGAHAPEFGFEHDLDNVRRATTELGIDYPVVIDNDFAIWRAFDNHYWPAVYLVDCLGRVRFQHFGEGAYEDTERVIQQLLGIDEDTVRVDASGLAEAADWDTLRSPETYLGSGRGERARRGRRASALALNQWALSGEWSVRDEAAELEAADGSIAYRFQARDLNLVLEPPASGAPVRFSVRLDGQPPGDAHGLDVDDSGEGTRDRAADVPTRPPARRDRPAHVRDHVPRRRRTRVRLHLRLMPPFRASVMSPSGAATEPASSRGGEPSQSDTGGRSRHTPQDPRPRSRPPSTSTCKPPARSPFLRPTVAPASTSQHCRAT